MHSLNRILLLTLLAATLFATQSCRKEDIENNSLINGPSHLNNSERVRATVYGTVINESGNIVSGATVTLNENTTTTDNNGFFYFSNVITPKRASVVKVSKPGYFNGIRTLFVKSNNKHSVKIRLMTKGTAQTFSGATGGTVSFDGLTIAFAARSIVNKATGVAYNGTVSVYAHKIDPTTTDGLENMPGDLRGIGTDENEKVLISYGMMVAELYDASGNTLQIANNSEATVSLDVPTSLQGTAPATIPLWHFDEALGVWIEEGSATLQGNKYVGNVKHFSFWNCDTPAVAIDLQMTIVDQDGNPLQDYWITLTNTANNDQRAGVANSNGWVGGLVYPNATLTMTVSTPYNVCGNSQVVIYTQTVVTGSSNLDLGTIIVTINNSVASINAAVHDCNGNSLTNAVVLVQPLGISLSPDVSGNITYTLPCTPSTPVTLTAYDLTAHVNGSTNPTTLNSGVNNLGVITACGTINPFLNFTITNTVTSASETRNTVVPQDYVSLYDSSSTTTTTIYASLGSGSGSNGSYINFNVSGHTTGTFAVPNTYISVAGTSLPDQEFIFNATGSTATFTSYPTTGFVEGNFSINFTGNTTSNPYTATGSFRIPRQ